MTAEVSIIPDFKVQALVVGSGFGGSVAACRLSQAGLQVMLVERGRRFEAGDFPPLPEQNALLPEMRRWLWSVSQGLWDIIDLGEVVSAQAAGYGGGSLVYANVHLRPPEAVFDDKWPAEYRAGTTLKDFYDLAAAMLDVAPVTESPTLPEKLLKTKQLEQAMDRLGRKDGFFLPPLAVNYEPKTNAHGRVQRGCTGCGQCCTGCPETAKNTLDFNYLALAETQGAKIRTQCEVLNFEAIEGGKYRYRVKCLDHLEARTFFIHCEYLVLSAGVIHTTRLLATAKLPHSSDLEQLIGVGYFPGGDALGMVYDTKQPQVPSIGPTITSSTVHWQHSKPGSFFLLQDGGYAAQLDRMTGLLRAPAWLGRNRLSEGDGRQPKSEASTPSVPGETSTLPSIVDDLLQALEAGDFSYLVRPGVAAAFTAMLQELKTSLLLPNIVARTINDGISQRNKRLFGRLYQSLARPLSKLGALEKFLVSRAYGNDDGLALNALRAAFTVAGLPPSAVAAKTLNYDNSGGKHRTMLLAMGRDAAGGHLTFDKLSGQPTAELHLFELAPGYAAQEKLMTDVAKKLGGELRTNPGWTVAGKAVTVHNQGGCPMSDKPREGVTRPDGQVHGQPGLYVMDASVFCSSVGVNPSATILAIAERNVLRLIHTLQPGWAEGSTAGAKRYREHLALARKWRQRAEAVTPTKKAWTLSPPDVDSPAFLSDSLGIEFHETMTGYLVPTSEDPGKHDARYRELEAAGRPNGYVELKLHITQPDLTTFFHDDQHTLHAKGTLFARLPGDQQAMSHAVEGKLELFAPKVSPKAIPPDALLRRAAQQRLDKNYSSTTEHRETRYLNYSLKFSDPAKSGFRFDGYKRIRDQPGLGAWRDVSCLFCKLSFSPKEHEPRAISAATSVVHAAGAVRVDLFQFLSDQVPSIRATGANDAAGNIDPVRATWATSSFAKFFFVSLQRIYLPELNTLIAGLMPKAS